MSSGSDQPFGRVGTESPADIRVLFELCTRKQNDANLASFETMRDLVIRQVSLGQFPSVPIPEPTSLPSKLIALGGQYLELVQRLKTARDDSFWRELAQWLWFEGIRDPEEVVPAEVWRRLTGITEARAKGFWQANEYNAYLIRVWLPYMEPLMRKANWLRSDGVSAVNATLQTAGYDRRAVELVLSKPWRSVVQLSCEWLAQRSRYNSETLRNSYSRVFGQRILGLGNARCIFCNNPPLGEFWVSGNSVLHCAEHRADQLPSSEASGWTDRSGRRWWRDNLDIRCSQPLVNP